MRAADYFWPRVLKDTVRFRGTTDDDGDPQIVFDEAEVNARIERLVAQLLDYQFESAPHRVERSFRPGQMRSLKSGTGDAVALPISLSGRDLSGRMSSIEQVFLAGHDFGVALSVDWLMEQCQPHLERIRTPLEYTVTDETEAIRVSARVTELEVSWEEGDASWGRIRISAQGEVVNNDEVAFGFSLDDRLTVDFDAWAGSLRVLHRGPSAVNVTNMPGVEPFVAKNDIETRLRNAVNGYLTNLPSVPLGSAKDELVRLLKTLDDRANAQFVSARFGAADMVLFGRVSLSPRTPAVVQFEKSDHNNSFVAFASWAPGGWIERYSWEWQFYRHTEDESKSLGDRYVLSRPAVVNSRWGKPILPAGETRLPGLDGWGWMCLEIQGFQIDSVTGERVSFRKKTSTRYANPLRVLGFDRGSRLLGTLRWAAHIEDQPGDIGLVELGGAPVDRAAANCMVVYSAGGFDLEAANILAAGLDASAREDAGLMILALVGEDATREGGADLAFEIAEFSHRIGAHVEVVEDVALSWTRRLAIPPDITAWRLITPNGGFAWSHDGQITPAELARALNEHLWPSPSPHLRPIRAGVESARSVPPIVIGLTDEPNRTCPRIRFVSLTNAAGAGVIFAKAGSRPSESQLAIAARMWPQHSENARDVVVVLDGDETQAEELAPNYPEFELISDLDGDIAKRFGIRIWPTIVAVDGGGVVTGVRQGLYEFDDAP